MFDASLKDSEELMMLQLSGLGEQNIIFCLHVDNQEIYNEILSTFSKLRGGGGFKMLRLSEGGGNVTSYYLSTEQLFCMIFKCCCSSCLS